MTATTKPRTLEDEAREAFLELGGWNGVERRRSPRRVGGGQSADWDRNAACRRSHVERRVDVRWPLLSRRSGADRRAVPELTPWERVWVMVGRRNGGDRRKAEK